MKKPTIRDIANELNVTFSSVARALNDHPAISAATKKAVLEVAERLNYRSNKIASSLRSGKTNIIGVIVPNLYVNFFSTVVSEIERVLNENGYHILLYQSNDSASHESKGIETFLNSRVDGIIASTANVVNHHAYLEIVNRNVPLVFFDRIIKDIHAPSVTINDFKGGYLATEYLIKQGRKKIVHITYDLDTTVFQQRYEGYLAALKAHSLSVNDNVVFTGNFSATLGKEVIDELIDKNVAFDAVFCAEDITAIGTMQQLKFHGLKVPTDVSVIGFDNEPFGTLVEPTLSTIDQQSSKMGAEAAKLMLEQFEHNYIQRQNHGVILEPTLIIRNSC